MKSIVINTRDRLLQQSQEYCESLFSERVKILSLYDNVNLPEKAQKEYKLIPIKLSSKYFQQNYYSVLKQFWKYLRENPDLIYEILKYSSQDYLTSSFNNFIINDLFADIFHQDNISINLYYVIDKLFESEINKLENISDFQKVITNSNIGFILGGFLLKEDIQSYFSLILTDIIEGYENSDESSISLIFKVKELQEYFIKEEEKYTKELKRVDTDNEKKEIIRRKKKENYLFNQLYKMNLPNDTDTMSLCSSLTLTKNEEIIQKNKKESELFTIKYIPDISKKDLIEKINKEKNDLVKCYLQKKIRIFDKNSDIFSNQKLLENMQKSKKSEKLLYYYQKNFIISINLLNKLLKKFNSTLDAVPSSIKYISKIIYDLLSIKFKNVDTIDIYKQVGYFFFMKLFKYIFLSPDYYPIINNVILSECTKRNLFKIFEVFSQLISGDFYNSNEETSDYTPFNWYFIDNIHLIYNFCKNLISAHSPISKKNNNNKNSFFSYSVCFNKEIFETFINIIQKNSNILFKNNKHLKFKELTDNLIKNKEINNKKQENVINYFLYFEIIFSGIYINIKHPNLNNKNFKINEEEEINNMIQPKKSGHFIKSKINDNEKAELNNLISAKNLLSDILISLDENDINEISHQIKNNTTKEVLKTIKKYYTSKSFAQKSINKKIFKSNHEQKNIPTEWYLNSLLICLDKLNETYIKNDYNNLYSSLSKDINNSIKNYNFQLLSQIVEKLKYTKYYIKYFKNCQKKYIELIINSKIKNFIEKEKINVIMKLTYNLKEKYLTIYTQEINKDNNDLNKNKNELCKYINDFIVKFPNLTKIDKTQEPELFEVEDKINLKGALTNFMDILKVKMLKYFKENEKETAYNKIKKYILTKIYEKIYPQDYDNDDLLFFYKAISLSWVEPKHLKIPYDINVDNFIPITNSFFKQFDYEKSPACKMEVIAKIFNTINSALRFSKGENFSIDDIAPIFEYALIKARPERLSSNLRYLEFFIAKGSELKNMYFDFLKNNMNSIKEINYSQFDGINEEEFKQKCLEANKSYIG